MHPLSELRVGQTYDDAGAHVGMGADRGLDLRRIDV